MAGMAIKTAIKATILIAIFSIFLEVTPKNFLNYLIFLSVSYGLVVIYILWKRNFKFTITDSDIEVRNFMVYHKILSRNISEVFATRGYLQRKFGLESIYIISKGRNLLIKDKPLNNDIHRDLKKLVGERFQEAEEGKTRN